MRGAHPTCQRCKESPSVGLYFGPKDETPRTVLQVCRPCGEELDAERKRNETNVPDGVWTDAGCDGDDLP